MKKVYFTKEDLKGNYVDPTDCPIARAMKRLGHDVDIAGTSCHPRVTMKNGSEIELEPSCIRFGYIDNQRLKQFFSIGSFYLFGKPYFKVDI